MEAYWSGQPLIRATDTHPRLMYPKILIKRNESYNSPSIGFFIFRDNVHSWVVPHVLDKLCFAQSSGLFKNVKYMKYSRALVVFMSRGAGRLPQCKHDRPPPPKFWKTLLFLKTFMHNWSCRSELSWKKYDVDSMNPFGVCEEDCTGIERVMSYLEMLAVIFWLKRSSWTLMTKITASLISCIVYKRNYTDRFYKVCVTQKSMNISGKVTFFPSHTK